MMENQLGAVFKDPQSSPEGKQPRARYVFQVKPMHIFFRNAKGRSVTL